MQFILLKIVDIFIFDVIIEIIYFWRFKMNTDKLVLSLKKLKEDSLLALKEKNKELHSCITVWIGKIDTEGKIKKLLNKQLSPEDLLKEESKIILNSLQTTYKELQKHKNEFMNKADEKSKQFLDKIEKELSFLATYLPAELSDDELTVVIDKIIHENQVDLTDKSALGTIMKHARQKLDGKSYNGARLSELVKSKLNI